MRRSGVLLPTLLAVALSSPALAAGGGGCEVPDSVGPVHDLADLLRPDEEAVLRRAHLDLRDEGLHLEVALLETSGGCDLQTWTREAHRRWSLGGGPGEGAALLAVAYRDRRSQVESAPGVRSLVPDAEMAALVARHAAPLFRKNEWGRGLRSLYAGLSEHLRDHGLGAVEVGGRPRRRRPSPRPAAPASSVPVAPLRTGSLAWLADPRHGPLLLAVVFVVWALSLPLRGILVNRRFLTVGVLVAVLAWVSGRWAGDPAGARTALLLVLLVGFPLALYTTTRRCPRCGAGYLDHRERLLREPGAASPGLAERTTDCPLCPHHRVRTFEVPPRGGESQPSSPRTGGPARSFGGDSSSGSGAGRSF